MQSKFGLSLAGIYKQRQATSNECRAKQRNPSSEQQREQQQLSNRQPSCSNSTNWSNSKRPRDRECFGNIVSKAKAIGKDEEIRYRIRNQDALKQARFERRRLELEMQMKELETKHQLLEEEREQERKVKRTALENDDVRSQSTGAQEKSAFNWTPKKRDVSDLASRIDNLLTPERSTARFEVTPELNRHGHFSQYSSSRDRSSSVEDRDVSPRAGLLRYNSGYAGSNNLPKLKLNNFDGNPLEWPEWSNMFIATVDQRPIPDSEKMSHLKCLLTGKARSAISGMGYSGQFYGAAWSILERKIERPHVIIDAQLESLRKASQVKPHDSTGLIGFSVIVSNFVNVLK